MSNPWEEISLDDYEKHMSLDSVRQLQALDSIMKEQFSAYPVETAAVLGVAGVISAAERQGIGEVGL